MSEDIKWMAGIAVTMFVFFGGMLFSAFNNLSSRIKTGDDVLHDRLNRVRDDYVRRSDLDGHIQRLDNNVKDLREELRETRTETNHRLDAILATLSRSKKEE